MIVRLRSVEQARQPTGIGAAGPSSAIRGTRAGLRAAMSSTDSAPRLWPTQRSALDRQRVEQRHQPVGDVR